MRHRRGGSGRMRRRSRGSGGRDARGPSQGRWRGGGTQSLERDPIALLLLLLCFLGEGPRRLPPWHCHSSSAIFGWETAEIGKKGKRRKDTEVFSPSGHLIWTEQRDRTGDSDESDSGYAIPFRFPIRRSVAAAKPVSVLTPFSIALRQYNAFGLAPE